MHTSIETATPPSEARSDEIKKGCPERTAFVILS